MLEREHFHPLLRHPLAQQLSSGRFSNWKGILHGSPVSAPLAVDLPIFPGSALRDVNGRVCLTDQNDQILPLSPTNSLEKLFVLRRTHWPCSLHRTGRKLAFCSHPLEGPVKCHLLK